MATSQVTSRSRRSRSSRFCRAASSHSASRLGCARLSCLLQSTRARPTRIARRSSGLGGWVFRRREAMASVVDARCWSSVCVLMVGFLWFGFSRDGVERAVAGSTGARDDSAVEARLTRRSTDAVSRDLDGRIQETMGRPLAGWRRFLPRARSAVGRRGAMAELGGHPRAASRSTRMPSKAGGCARGRGTPGSRVAKFEFCNTLPSGLA